MYIWVATAMFALAWGAVEIHIPPSFTVQPPPYEEIISSDAPITLPCTAVGDPEPEYTWLKDGRELTYTPEIQLNNGDLSFTIPTIMNQGYYQCIASNQYGKALSVVTYLQQVVLGRFGDVTAVTEKVVNEGESVMLQCSPPKSVPAPVISWGLQEEDADGNVPQGAVPTPVSLDKRIQIDGEGNLMIAHSEVSDSQIGHKYVCQATNNRLISSAGGSLHSLRVNAQPGATPQRRPSIMYITQSPSIVLKGTDAIMQCLYSGNPTPSVSWEKVGGSMPGNGRTIFEEYNTRVKIVNFQKSDEGTYRCRGSNAAGSSSRSEVELVMHSVPQFRRDSEPVNFNGTNDDEVIIRCDADAIPSSSTQWYMNGDPLNVDSPPERMLFEQDNKVLKIRKVCKDCDDDARATDLMVIQCNSSNTHGYAFGQGYLNVLNRTEIFLAPPDERQFTRDEKELSLQCQGRTDAATDLVMTWHKGSDPIASLGDDNIVVEVDNTLYIDMHEMDIDEKAHYQDHYRCEATNGYSTVSRTSNVIVEGAPAPVVAAASFPWWWIVVIIAILLLLLILLLCCCLCAQRNKGDDYDVEKMERKNGNNPEKENKDNGYHEYQRPESQPMKGSRASLASSVPLDSDDDNMADEYGDIDPGRFNEDGSFLGMYTNKKNHTNV